jgi:hypothetical protein
VRIEGHQPPWLGGPANFEKRVATRGFEACTRSARWKFKSSAAHRAGTGTAWRLGPNSGEAVPSSGRKNTQLETRPTRWY